jgi:FkbM family methyltransferase
MSLTYIKELVLEPIRWTSSYLPLEIQKVIASGYIERRTRECGVQIALYDPKTDLLRFPEPAEAMGLLGAGIIADAVRWMLKISSRLPKGGVIFDVGGFRGMTSQWFSRVASKVHTFEPMPENIDSIQQVLSVRDISNVSVHQIALSDQIGTSDFHIYQIKGHNSLGKVNTASKYLYTIKVPTTTLDEFTRQNGIERIEFSQNRRGGFRARGIERSRPAVVIRENRANPL